MPFVPEALKSRDVCPGFPCVDVDSKSNCIWQNSLKEKRREAAFLKFLNCINLKNLQYAEMERKIEGSVIVISQKT